MNRGRRTRGDDGAAAVEAAMVTGLVVLVIFGIIEFAFIVRDYVSVTSATSVGARIASTAADSGPCVAEPDDLVPCPARLVPELAQEAADGIGESIATLPAESIKFLIVYKANEPGHPENHREPPSLANCLTDCVAYTWNPAQERFRYSQGTWDSTQINACAASHLDAAGNPGILDTVGVQVVVERSLLTGLFGASMGLRDHTVMKFEPLANKGCEAGDHA